MVRQEILAEVIDDAGAVFRRVAEMATATLQESPIGGHVYVVGVDWGRTHDATVFSVIDVTLKHQVYLDRMTGVDYEMQLDRLIALNAKFRPAKIMVEVNAMGQPLFERLKRQGLPVVAFVTSNPTKQVIIDALTMAFEQAAIRILADETQVNELQAYEIEPLDNGKVRFGSPSGFHDDTVVALALAWAAATARPRRRPRSREY
jgi:phage FluMu gp28-like protein